MSPPATWLHRGAGTAVVPPVLGGETFGSGYEEVVLRTGERTGAALDAAGRPEAAGWTARG